MPRRAQRVPPPQAHRVQVDQRRPGLVARPPPSPPGTPPSDGDCAVRPASNAAALDAACTSTGPRTGVPGPRSTNEPQLVAVAGGGIGVPLVGHLVVVPDRDDHGSRPARPRPGSGRAGRPRRRSACSRPATPRPRTRDVARRRTALSACPHARAGGALPPAAYAAAIESPAMKHRHGSVGPPAAEAAGAARPSPVSSARASRRPPTAATRRRSHRPRLRGSRRG